MKNQATTKYKIFLYKIGIPFIIIIIAIFLSYLVMKYADDFYKDSIDKLEISIEDGKYLTTNYEKDDDNIYMFWETDAGKITVDDGSKLFNNDESLGYYAYSQTDEHVTWSPMDYDGNEYEIATVRVSVYQVEDEQNGIYYLGKVFAEMVITVTIDENGNIKKVDDRFFCNPVRKNSENDWSQVYLYDNKMDGIQTFRFRTGEEIDVDKAAVLCFECDKPLLAETDLLKGAENGFAIKEKNSQQTVIKPVDETAINTVSISYSLESMPCTIEAYLVNYDVYENEDITEEQKYHKAIYEIKKVE